MNRVEQMKKIQNEALELFTKKNNLSQITCLLRNKSYLCTPKFIRIKTFKL